MKLDVLLAVPEIYQAGLDLGAVRNCFPYGKVNIQIQNGGMIATSGKMIETVHKVVASDSLSDQSRHLGQLAELARMRLDIALEGMADGFALYDSQDRLVNYNRKYVELNPHIADLIMPGSRYEDMLREGVRRGGFVPPDRRASP